MGHSEGKGSPTWQGTRAVPTVADSTVPGHSDMATLELRVWRGAHCSPAGHTWTLYSTINGGLFPSRVPQGH